MLKTILLRLLSSILMLFLLISFLFVLIRLSPGNPTDKYISTRLGSELSEKVTEKFSLNQPIADQYIAFVANVFKGDMGISYNYRLPVFDIIWEYFSFTLVFSLTSFMLQIVISIMLSVWIIKRKSKLLEGFVSNSAILVYSIPSFVLGVALIYIFSVELSLFPISGLHSLDHENFSLLGKITDTLHHLVLPMITLTSAGVAMFYKYTKDSMDEVLGQTFIINLVSCGLDNTSILKKHVIPNSLRPVLSVAGVELGILLGGTLITEVIFSLPGMGRLAINSILSRDYPMVIGCVFTAGTAMIIVNFIADIIKLKLDKRLIKGILN